MVPVLVHAFALRRHQVHQKHAVPVLVHAHALRRNHVHQKHEQRGA